MNTNRLLAGIIVQLCRMQTHQSEYPMQVLTRLGLTPQEIADVLGTSAATVHVTKSRAKKKAAQRARSADVMALPTDQEHEP